MEMGEYDIGRDFQDLRSRVERLERVMGNDRTVSDRRTASVATAHLASGVTTGTPIHWKLEKREHLPPSIYSNLGLPLTADLRDLEIMTWPWLPEPTIVYSPLSSSSEFFRMENQSFTKITFYHTGNSGIIDVFYRAFYAATLVASGSFQDDPSTPPASAMIFDLTLLDAQGAQIGLQPRAIFGVQCRDNHNFATPRWNIAQPDYDRISGASGAFGTIGGYRVVSC
jgi:hypothetical protein